MFTALQIDAEVNDRIVFAEIYPRAFSFDFLSLQSSLRITFVGSADLPHVWFLTCFIAQS